MFSVLTAKIMSGVSAALLLSMGVMYLVHKGETSSLNKTIIKHEATVARLTADNITLKANQTSLEAGVNLCNSGVENAKRLADQATANGAALLEQVKTANASLEGRIKRIAAMPSQSCEDAEAILRAGGQP